MSRLSSNSGIGTSFNVGDSIKIVHLDDPYVGLDYSGRTGVIDLIDGIGQLHGTWGSIALIPGIDIIEKQ